jgi:hypothetical protein
VGAFSHDDNGLAFANFTVLGCHRMKYQNRMSNNAYLLDGSAQLIFPRHLLWWALRNENEVCAPTGIP